MPYGAIISDVRGKALPAVLQTGADPSRPAAKLLADLRCAQEPNAVRQFWWVSRRRKPTTGRPSALLGDRDFADVDGQDITPDSPGWTLETELRRLPGVGRTIASILNLNLRAR